MSKTQQTAGEKPRIGEQEVRRAAELLKKYRQGKVNLERRIIDNEQFWKLRHWPQMEKTGEGGNPGDPQPTSGWLVNCILSKHADAMDCYPEPTVLPREPGDRAEAAKLTRILPAILKKTQFKRTYSSAWWYKLKSGCAVYGVFWDAGKLNGLGDVSIRRMDLLNLFWEPGVTDIQDSANFFSTELVSHEVLEEQYPQLKGKLGGGGFTVSRFLYDDQVDTSDKALVVDWYYHTREKGRRVLQYCKFTGETVLYATENDPELRERGWYDHGKYPFVFDVLFPEEGTPCGYGYVDLCKSPQKQIDLMNQAILKNTLAAATPRFFIRSDGAVNENEYADWTRPFVHTNGNLTWRVLSNLLSNACKYSQPHTRVYIDIKKEKDTVILSMKNISRDALNIPAEELMERFVRGDSSRHTEGSGLGLNIAQSLVGLQKGTFSLEIEGDLFKAFVAFPATEPPAPPAEEMPEEEMPTDALPMEDMPIEEMQEETEKGE